MSFSFRRVIYGNIQEGLKRFHVIFLLGPRKCGKTVALRQVEEDRGDAVYVDFKGLTREESQDVFSEICESIRMGREKVYLLDEITYAFFPEYEIERIAVAYTEVERAQTRVVLTGSQSVALETWGMRSFSAKALYLREDFLSYPEWLSYMQEVHPEESMEPSEDTYQRFLKGTRKFYDFSSLAEYLQGCLEETIISNQKTSNVLFGNDCYLLDVETLVDIVYQTLFTLHNQVSAKAFESNHMLRDGIEYYYRDVCRELNLDERIAASFVGRYSSFRSKEAHVLEQGLLFLLRAGLITITPVSSSLEHIPNYYQDLWAGNGRFRYKDELFRTYNICIRYPMFYVEILKDILEDHMPESIPRALLGSIVECHVRGILSSKNCFTYHDSEGREIDYVNVLNQEAIEITVADKRMRQLHFECVPEGYKRTLLTKSSREEVKGIRRVPYYEFIYERSRR